MQDTHILKAFADNPALVEAVRKVFTRQFDQESISTDESNERLGQKLRARLEGLQKVEEAFREIAKHKTVKENQPVRNPAR